MATFKLRYPGWRSKALTFSYDDGVEQDIRLVKIFDQYGIKGTFNINTGCIPETNYIYPPNTIHRRMTEKQIYELFVDSQHEVAIHTLTHPFLDKMPTNMVLNEVLNDRKNIERMWGKLACGMAYPFGTTSDTVVEALKLCGIVYSRTCNTTNSLEFNQNDFLNFSPTCHHNSPQLEDLSNKFINESPNRDPWLLYVWGHSYEFDDNNNWSTIENLCKKTSFKSDIWYVTNIEFFNYVNAYKSLVFSVDGDLVYNPTSTEIFFIEYRTAQKYSIHPGECKRILSQ